jgi:hypothetical protein
MKSRRSQWYRMAMEILTARIYYQQASMTKEEYNINSRKKFKSEWYSPVYRKMCDVETWAFEQDHQ